MAQEQEEELVKKHSGIETPWFYSMAKISDKTWFFSNITDVNRFSMFINMRLVLITQLITNFSWAGRPCNCFRNATQLSTGNPTLRCDCTSSCSETDRYLYGGVNDRFSCFVSVCAAAFYAGFTTVSRLAANAKADVVTLQWAQVVQKSSLSNGFLTCVVGYLGQRNLCQVAPEDCILPIRCNYIPLLWQQRNGGLSTVSLRAMTDISNPGGNLLIGLNYCSDPWWDGRSNI